MTESGIVFMTSSEMPRGFFGAGVEALGVLGKDFAAEAAGPDLRAYLPLNISSSSEPGNGLSSSSSCEA